MNDKTIDSDIARLRSELADLRADIGALSETMGSLTGKAAENAKDRIADTASRAGAAVRENAQMAQDAASKSIAENPLTAIAMAFGIGMVIGKLMDRR